MNPLIGTFIDLTTLGVLLWTLYWVRRYTIVTEKIHSAGYRPEIVLQVTQDNPRVGAPNLRGFNYHNIGVGSAFDVQMKDWTKNDWRVEWDDPPSVLEKGHATKAVFFVTQDGESGGLSRDYLDLGRVISDNPERKLDGLNIPFEITYRDSAAIAHKTQGMIQYDVVSGAVRVRYSSLV